MTPVLTALLLTGCIEHGVAVLNDTPTAAITSHVDGATEREGAILLEGAVSDGDDPLETLTVSWFADGSLVCEGPPQADGSTACALAAKPGHLSVDLVVLDPDAASAAESLILDVVSTAVPQAEILGPEDGPGLYEDVPVRLWGQVADEEDGPSHLVAWWTSDGAGPLGDPLTPDPAGQVVTEVTVPAGTHALTLHVRDADGKEGAATTTLTVGPENRAPGCEITSPESDLVSRRGQILALRGEIWDPDVPTDWLEVSWSSDLDGTLGSLTPDVGGQVVATAALSTGSHVLTLRATDERGATCADTLAHTVGEPPVLTVTSPAPGEVIDEGEAALLEVAVDDGQDRAEDLAITWTSDLDGDLWTGSPDPDGTLAVPLTLSVGDHVLTVTARDLTGLTASATTDLTVNGAPTAPVISLSGTPGTSDDLAVSIDTPSVDPEGATVSYAWTWAVDGSASTASTTDTLPSSATARGETWAVVVTPSDGRVDGASATASATVANTAPTVSLSLSPSPARTEDTVEVSAVVSDVDGDAVSLTYAWSVDGTVVAESGASLDGLWFSEGEAVVVEVTPTDGTDPGAAVMASLTVANTAPTAPVVDVLPATPVAGADDLLCVIDTESTDADGDDVSYTLTWSVDGVAYTGAESTMLTDDTVPAEDLSGDEVWVCSATPNDGDEDGAAAAATVTILDGIEGDVALGDADGILVGEAADDGAGAALAGGFDADGDGYDDLLVGATGYGSTGAAYLAYGPVTGSSDLSTAVRLAGESSSDRAGSAVVAGPDLDGDGYDDLLVGADREDGGGRNAGAVYLLHGPVTTSASLSSYDGKLVGEEVGDGAGCAGASVGDVDGDGDPDVLVGAQYWDDTGAAYLVSGAWIGTVDLSTASARLEGESTDDYAGSTLDGAGDVDGDGHPDLVVGAWGDDDGGTNAGAAYLVLGPVTSDVALSAADAKLVGETADDRAAQSLSGAGDVDGDGYDDLAVGAPREDTAATSAGAVYLVLGPVSGTVDLSTAEAKLLGEGSGDLAGTSVAGGQDVDADGYADLLVGSSRRGSDDEGAAYLLYGPVSGTMDLSAADALLEGEHADDHAGDSVAHVGDVDGDGFGDISVGATNADNGGTDSGATYLLLGGGR